MTRRQPLMTCLTAALACAALAAPALAIQPRQWVQDQEAEFSSGKTHGTVVTNLGDVKLATGTHELGKMPDKISVIDDLQPLKDAVYIAGGPAGTLLEQVGKKITTVLTVPKSQIFALGVYQGELLVGVSSEKSRLAVLRQGKLHTLATLDVRYIWDMVVDGSRIFVATGTKGKVLMVDMAKKAAKGKDGHGPAITTVLDTEQTNVLCLGLDAHHNLYAGTDSEGLIYRVNMANGHFTPYVLYDAAEPEIGALLVQPDGTVYAGTADASQAKPGRLGKAVSEPAGRSVPSEEPTTEEPVKPQPKPEPKPLNGAQGGSGQFTPEAPEAPETPATQPAEAPQTQPAAAEDAPGDSDKAHAKASAEDEAKANAKPGAKDAPDANAGAKAAMPLRLAEADAAKAPAASPAKKDAAKKADNNKKDDGQAHPTAAQFDRLRELIRAKLEAARQGGQLDTQLPNQAAPTQPGTGENTVGRPSPTPSEPSKRGNAVYRIDPQGFVSEIFRQSVMVLKIVPHGDRLLVATGNEGQIYSLNPATHETTVLNDLKPQQVPAMAVTARGDILVGTANPAKLLRLDSAFAGRGTYTSSVLDASQVSLFGAIKLTADIDAGDSVLVETRSGNVENPKEGPWSAWSKPQAFMPNAGHDPMQPRSMPVTSPPARFFQYRLTLTSNRHSTPIVSRVEENYVTPNLAPRISSIKAEYPDVSKEAQRKHAAPPTKMRIVWKAKDSNDDQLIYKLEYRPAGSKKFLQMAKDVEGTSGNWETHRVPDGWYVIRVIASDRLDNPADMAKTTTRESDPVLVDNTPPAFGKVGQNLAGGNLHLAGTMTDAFSDVAEIGYSVDDDKHYKPILPDDLIFDSTREAWSITIPRLAPGPHVVTLRVGDARGNTAYKSVIVNVPGK